MRYNFNMPICCLGVCPKIEEQIESAGACVITQTVSPKPTVVAQILPTLRRARYREQV